jgi:filamentous hemagglutinin
VTILGQSISVSAAIPSLASFRLEGGTLTAATGVDLVIETSRDISIVGGSTIDVVTGNMLFIANLGVTPTTGDFAGIVLQATTISAAGDMVCLGRGGDDAATTDHDGVRLLNSCSLAAGGSIAIQGEGGVSAGGSVGITSDGSSHVLISVGSVSLEGVVDDPEHHGVFINGAAIDGQSGIVIEGTPGVIEASGTTLSSAYGDIVIVGTGAGSAGAGEIDGVDVENAAITAGADLTIVGVAGAGSAGDNDGVEIAGAAFSVAGSMTVVGTGGAGDGAGNDGVEGTGPAIIVPGSLVFEGTAGTGVGGGHYGLQLGSRSLSSSGVLSLTGIGGTERNGVFINGAAIDGQSGIVIEGTPGVIEAAGTTLSSAFGDIVISGTGAGSAGAGEIDGVDVENASITAGGDLTIVGEAGAGGAGDNDGVEIAGAAFSVAGSMTVVGTGGAGDGAGNDGVEGAGPSIIVAGSLVFEGTAGSGAGGGHYGLQLGSRSLSSGGLLSLTGVGGTERYGVFIYGATIDGASGIRIEGTPGIIEAAVTTLSSATGDIVMSGTGAGSAGAGEIDGVDVEYASIAANGDLTIVGVAGAGSAGDNDGIEIAGAAFSVAGSMTMIGTGGAGDGAGNDGVEGDGPAIIAAGHLVFEGTAGSGAGGGHYGLHLGSRSLASTYGEVYLNGVGGTERYGVFITGATIDGASGIAIEGTPGTIEAAWTTLSSASGNIFISGTGAGSAGAGEIDGVDVEGAWITAGGDLTIVGVAGAGGAGDNDGVEAQFSSSSISGNVEIVGWAGSGAGGHHDGVEVANLAVGGSISIRGFGGFDAFMNDGVKVLGTLDSAGALSIQSYGGYGGGDSRGSSLAAGGLLRSVGPLTIKGYGGGGAAGTNYGISVDADSEIDNGCPMLLWGVAGKATPREDGVVIEPGANITIPQCLEVFVPLFAEDFERGHLLPWERVVP